MSIVDRGAKDKAVGFFCLFDKFITDIVFKDTTILSALVASDTITDWFYLDLKNLCFDSFFFELSADFLQCNLVLPSVWIEPFNKRTFISVSFLSIPSALFLPRPPLLVLKQWDILRFG